MNLSRLHTQWWLDNYKRLPDSNIKHAHLYNVKHRLNSSAYRCQHLCRHSDISTFFVRSRGCRNNRCRLYYNIFLKANQMLVFSTVSLLIRANQLSLVAGHENSSRSYIMESAFWCRMSETFNICNALNSILLYSTMIRTRGDLENGRAGVRMLDIINISL